VIPQILEMLNINAQALTDRLDQTLKMTPKANIFGGGAGQIFITPRVKRIIDLANEEANRLKDEYISTEHIFPGNYERAQTLPQPACSKAPVSHANACWMPSCNCAAGSGLPIRRPRRATVPWKNISRDLTQTGA